MTDPWHAHPPLSPSDALTCAQALLLAASGDDAGMPRKGEDWNVVRVAAGVIEGLGRGVATPEDPAPPSRPPAPTRRT